MTINADNNPNLNNLNNPNIPKAPPIFPIKPSTERPKFQRRGGFSTPIPVPNLPIADSNKTKKLNTIITPELLQEKKFEIRLKGIQKVLSDSLPTINAESDMKIENAGLQILGAADSQRRILDVPTLGARSVVGQLDPPHLIPKSKLEPLENPVEDEQEALLEHVRSIKVCVHQIRDWIRNSNKNPRLEQPFAQIQTGLLALEAELCDVNIHPDILDALAKKIPEVIQSIIKYVSWFKIPVEVVKTKLQEIEAAVSILTDPIDIQNCETQYMKEDIIQCLNIHPEYLNTQIQQQIAKKEQLIKEREEHLNEINKCESTIAFRTDEHIHEYNRSASAPLLEKIKNSKEQVERINKEIQELQNQIDQNKQKIFPAMDKIINQVRTTGKTSFISNTDLDKIIKDNLSTQYEQLQPALNRMKQMSGEYILSTDVIINNENRTDVIECLHQMNIEKSETIIIKDKPPKSAVNENVREPIIREIAGDLGFSKYITPKNEIALPNLKLGKIQNPTVIASPKIEGTPYHDVEGEFQAQYRKANLEIIKKRHNGEKVSREEIANLKNIVNKIYACGGIQSIIELNIFAMIFACVDQHAGQIQVCTSDSRPNQAMHLQRGDKVCYDIAQASPASVTYKSPSGQHYICLRNALWDHPIMFENINSSQFKTIFEEVIKKIKAIDPEIIENHVNPNPNYLQQQREKQRELSGDYALTERTNLDPSILQNLVEKYQKQGFKVENQNEVRKELHQFIENLYDKVQEECFTNLSRESADGIKERIERLQDYFEGDNLEGKSLRGAFESVFEEIMPFFKVVELMDTNPSEMMVDTVKKEDLAAEKNMWTLLNTNLDPNIRILSNTERENCELGFKGSRLSFNGQIADGEYLAVLGPDNKIYMHPAQKGFDHISFFGKKPLLWWGTFTVKGGIQNSISEVEYLANYSQIKVDDSMRQKILMRLKETIPPNLFSGAQYRQYNLGEMNGNDLLQDLREASKKTGKELLRIPIEAWIVRAYEQGIIDEDKLNELREKLANLHTLPAGLVNLTAPCQNF